MLGQPCPASSHQLVVGSDLHARQSTSSPPPRAGICSDAESRYHGEWWPTLRSLALYSSHHRFAFSFAERPRLSRREWRPPRPRARASSAAPGGAASRPCGIPLPPKSAINMFAACINRYQCCSCPRHCPCPAGRRHAGSPCSCPWRCPCCCRCYWPQARPTDSGSHP